MRRYIAALLIALFVGPLFGHHSVAASFDASKAMTIQGMITRMDFTNPHVWVYMDIRNDNGSITNWRVQIATPGALMKAGFEKTLIDFTKPYSVEIWPAFDGSKHGAGRTMTSPDGRKFDVSDKWPDGPKSNPTAK